MISSHFALPSRLIFLSLALLLTGAACAVGVKTGPADGGIFKSTDSGTTWKQAVFVGQTDKGAAITIANLSVSRLVFSPVDPGTLFAVAPDSIWQTQNAGDQWKRIFAGGVQGFAPSPAVHDTLYLASGNRIFTTTNGGQDWKPIYIDGTTGTTFSDLVIDPHQPQRLFATTSHAALLKSEDGGVRWQLVYSFPEVVVRLLIHPSNPGTLYAIHASGNLERSTDAGVTWTSLTPKKQNESRFSLGAYRAVAIIPERANGLLYATQYGLWRTLDAGTTWESMSLVTQPNTVSIGAVVVDPKQETHLYYTADGALYRSLNNGGTWQTVPLPSARAGTALVTYPSDGAQMYLGFSPVTKKK